MENRIFGHNGAPSSLLDVVSDFMRRYISPSEKGTIFLDFGATDSQLAEHIRDQLGFVYVGISYSHDRINSLKSRGFEAYKLPKGLTSSEVEEFLSSLPFGGKAKLVFFLGNIAGEIGLQGWLKILSTIAKVNESPIILRANNISHIDSILQKILNNEPWNDVSSELLGHPFYSSEKSLNTSIERSGFEVVFRSSLLSDGSKEEEQQGHPFLEKDSIYRYLLTELLTPSAQQNPLQFIWLCVPGNTRLIDDPTPESREISRRPFATVAIRTQGDRAVQLREALLCLGGQTFQNFEVLILLHSTNPAKHNSLEMEIAKLPIEFVSKVRIIVVDGGSRTRPLNFALREGVGDYFTFLDDDDYVLPNWLQEFYRLSRVGRGRVLRSQAVTQEHYQTEFQESCYTRSASAILNQYNDKFSLVEHLIENQSPFMTLAFPRSIVDYLHFEFDESLSTTEDWDFLLRSASALGVQSSTTVTSVYRKWLNAKSSSSIPKYEWEANKLALLSRLNSKPLVVPPGEIFALKSVIERRLENENRLRLSINQDHESLVNLIRSLQSRSWRWTAPMRAVISLLRMRKHLSLSLIDVRDRKQVQDLTSIIHSSFWWKISSRLRKSETQ